MTSPRSRASKTEPGTVHLPQDAFDVEHLVGERSLVEQPAILLFAVAASLFGRDPGGHIAKAIDSADDLHANALRPGIPFVYSAVLEFEDVEAFCFRLRGVVVYQFHEAFGVEELVLDKGDRVLVTIGRHDAVGNAPELHEPPVVAQEQPFTIHDENPIRRRLQGRGEKRIRLTQFVLDHGLRRLGLLEPADAPPQSFKGHVIRHHVALL